MKQYLKIKMSDCIVKYYLPSGDLTCHEITDAFYNVLLGQTYTKKSVLSAFEKIVNENKK